MNRIHTTLITTLSVAVAAVLCVCSVSTAFAGNTNDIINRERLRSRVVIKEIIQKKDGFKSYQEVSKLGLQDYQKQIQNIKERHIKQAQKNGFIKPAPQAIVFVSFSMPILSLKQVIQDASSYQIPVVVRGLYKNSFKETIEKVFDLVKEDNKGGISINPVWFKKYDIKTVPALVVSCNGEKSDRKAGDWKFEKKDVVYGNIPLKRALTIVAEQGSASKVAKDVLSRGRR